MGEEIVIGNRVIDTFNGYKGTVTGVAQYMHRSMEYLVEPENLDKDGQPVRGLWIAAGRLRLQTEGD